jgi:hypothetical protein
MKESEDSNISPATFIKGGKIVTPFPKVYDGDFRAAGCRAC